MAWGDAFTLEQVTAFELADFAQRCGVERKLLRREARRMAWLATDLRETTCRSLGKLLKTRRPPGQKLAPAEREVRAPFADMKKALER